MFYGNQDNLLQYAKKILSDKVLALQNDVKVCTNPGPHLQNAPFTALLACFSTLDFLSALYGGNTSTKAPTTDQVKIFLETFFGFDLDQRELLLQIYRHKLVHLFQPGHVVEYKGNTYSWMIHNSEPSLHLKVIKRNILINPAPSVRIKIEFSFSISISDFLSEIIKASEAYFNKLATDLSLQNKFEKAINDIFSL